ncbi:MAG: hypothetical protein OEQ39_14595 [Gammaproteobacteria bacterium]|nr:hypothetical protein [Gammaproteobacteria bacterium]MDH3468728.1 hypothetical protein [Gammaproteobacteria bacterium]
MVDIAVSFTEFRNLDAAVCGQPLLDSIVPYVPDNIPLHISHIRLGNEFCERLLPTRRQIEKAAALADQYDVSFALVTPNLTDQGLKRLQHVMSAVPAASEIIVNDWGVADMLVQLYPALSLTAGRLLCKHLKEPRIAEPTVDPVVDWPVKSAHFRELLASFGINRVEVDLAPHTSMPTAKADGVKLTLHLHNGYTAKSHVCKIGSIKQPTARKFTPEHNCQRECLRYVTSVSRMIYPSRNDLGVFQRGNTWFYNYTERMNASIAEAIRNTVVDRTVVMLDWHEDHRTH